LYGPLTSSSENDIDSDEDNDQIFYAADGTVWARKDEVSGGPGKNKYKSKFDEDYGPNGHAKRNIMLGNYTSAFSLLVDDKMLEYIKNCTELIAFRVLEKKRQLVKKLKAFIAILYARGVY
jgi:hypothetical protein